MLHLSVDWWMADFARSKFSLINERSSILIHELFCLTNGKLFTCRKTMGLYSLIILLFLVFWMIFFAGKAFAAEKTLYFDPVQDSRVTGYKIHYGQSKNFGTTVDLKNNTSYKLSNLVEGATYYFAASSYDAYGNQSALSDVLVYTVSQNEIIIDNKDLSATSKNGTWGVSDASDPYGTDSVWSRDGTTFTWHFTPAQSSDYELLMWWTQWPSRSTKVPVDIRHAGGTTRVIIDQTVNGGRWNSLGDFYFESGKSYSVTITSQAEPSSTCADAVRILPIFETPTDIIIDNKDASATSKTGTWEVSGASYPYGSDSVWSRDGDSFTWHFNPALTSHYELRMWWTEWPSRSTGVPVRIEHAGGTSWVKIDQTRNGGAWNRLGDYTFESGQSYKITIISPDSPSSTCADAVRFSAY
jgi:hypothetical protein